MNGWLICLCFSIMLLWFRQIGNASHWNKVVQTMGGLTDTLGMAAGLSQEKIEEARKAWIQARIKSEQQVAVTSVLALMAAVFLIALMVRGKI